MLFSSGEFIFLFLPVSLLGYQLFTRFGRNAALGWFTAISLFFYGRWNPKYLLLLFASILMNYLFAQWIAREKSSEEARSRSLVLGITANLLLLMWFKYLFPLLHFLDRYLPQHHDFGDVILPLGISFFTFTQIAYLIDLRQGIAAKQGLLPYSVFVTFFPHLIAGPIIHPREIMPQLEDGRLHGLRLDDVTLGLSWFVLGLAKKVLIADKVALGANPFYANPGSYSFAWTWISVLCYSMQLYFDFSGYSDMALGLARMFSIEFPYNFNSPYKAANIIDFWQRFHMTLTRYIGEYLYTPILRVVNSRRIDAGKKVTRKAQATPEGFFWMVAFPLLTSMGIAGIWHGAGLQYLVFGLLHGVYLVINHGWRLLTPKGSRWNNKLPVPLSIAITFLGVVVGEVYFRAKDLHQANEICLAMLGRHGYGAAHPASASASTALHVLLLAAVLVWTMPNTQQILGQSPATAPVEKTVISWLAWRPNLAWSVGLAALFCLAIVEIDAGASFLYFQF